MSYPITEINQRDKKYPKLLAEISNPPRKLYCRGNIDLLSTECFSVVGTRRMTDYGKEAAQKITTDLARYFTIVSGLALGIDAVAHKAALDVKGYTIAVLSGGVTDRNIGPRSNYRLAQQILINDGLLISEHESKDEIYRSDFPIRNRIISGISKGVLIVESDLKSGSLVTASLAVHQNRDVFAVPGNIFSTRTAGPHFLIKKGAKMVTEVQDIFEEYGMLALDKARPKPKNLSETERLVFSVIENSNGATTDQIIESSGKDTSQILVALTELELKGIVRQTGNGKYLIK